VRRDERVDIHLSDFSSVAGVTGPQQSVVTGDAVVLDIHVAQLPVRVLSALIDVVVVVVLYVVGLLLWALTLSDVDSALSDAVLVAFTVLALLGYPVICETAMRGKSLGKLVMGLRVVSDDGSPERFRQALFRALAGVIEIWTLTGAPAVICSLASARGKRLGDVFAGTVVLSERTPRTAPPPPMPPQLAGWAATLQLSALAPDLAETLRQFLSRAGQLNPLVRDQLAVGLANQVGAVVAPPPPPGAPPALVLAAVLAERHRRELARWQPGLVPPA
jgi:uncharacterized RDD family membrane protein YckC